MLRKESTLAAVLFVFTGLALPVLFSMEQQQAPAAEQVPFMLRQAFLELRLDMAVSVSLGGAELDETQEQSPVGAFAFHVDPWLATITTMDPAVSARLLDSLAPMAAAMGRRTDAAQLLARAGHTLPDQAPWSCLVSGSAASVDECMKELPEGVPPEAAAFASTWLAEGGQLLERQDMERVGVLVGPFLGRMAVLAVVGILLFIAGLVLLLLAPKLIRRFRAQDFGLEGFRFSAPPLATFMVFLMWFIVMLTVHLVVWAGAEQGGINIEEQKIPLTVFAYLVYAAGGIALIVMLGRAQVHPLTRAIDMQMGDITGRALAFGAAGYVVAIPVVLALTHISAMLVGTGPGVNPVIPELLAARGSTELWLLVFNVCVLAPLFEEIFFRGFLFQQFKRFYSVPNAAALSALAFAAVHLSIESFIPLFGLGVLMAISYHLVQSLWAAILLHALWNGATVAVVLVLF